MVNRDPSGILQGSQECIQIPRMSQEQRLTTETKASEETKSKCNTSEKYTPI